MEELRENFVAVHPAAHRGIEGASSSGVSWGAIFAGAVGAASLSLILLFLGSGLGLSSVSPWSARGASGTTMGLVTILWITFTQIAASGMGGYLAGRLRTKWAGVHTDEVYFRDTAHGFMAWSVATLLTAAFLGSMVSSILGAGVQAGAAVVGGAATTAAGATAAAAPGIARSVDSAGEGPSSPGATGYFTDSLFRKDVASTPADASASGANVGASTAEVGRILSNGIRTGALPPEDVKYAGQLVAQRTGLSQQDAEKRVTDTFAKIQTEMNAAATRAKEAADAARKAFAYGSLWLFVSLLIGAFVASLAATYGGRRRDL